jgi:hypothetical protein
MFVNRNISIYDNSLLKNNLRRLIWLGQWRPLGYAQSNEGMPDGRLFLRTGEENAAQGIDVASRLIL